MITVKKTDKKSEKKDAKNRKVQQLREDLVKTLEAYDIAVAEILKLKRSVEITNKIPFDDKKHHKICERASRELGLEVRTYKEYFLILLLPEPIWNAIEEGKDNITVSKLKELAKPYAKNELSDKETISLFNDMLENNLTVSALRKKVKERLAS